MRILFGVLFLFYVSGAFAQNNSKMSEIDTLMKQGKYSAAKSQLDKQISRNPGNDSLLTRRGICFYELNKSQDAYDDLSAAIAKNPQMAMAYLYRAKVLMSAGETPEAVNDLNLAVRHAPDDSVRVWSLMNRAGARLKMRQTTGAIEDDSAALAIDSLNIGALNDMGMALNQLGRHDEGLECLYKISRIDSTLIFVPMNIGFILMSKERYAEAIEWINKALKLDDKQPLAYNNRGYAKLKSGNTKEALTDINKSLSIKENNNYAYRNRALVYIEMKEIDKACADMRRSVELGFTEQYGNEVKDLMRTHCSKK